MQVSQTYNYEKNDHINRANMALVCSVCFGIKEVSPSLYKIAAPVSEISSLTKDGMPILSRTNIEDAIPWDERSMKTFGVVYTYESAASFIGRDGKTYIVPNDRPVIDHLRECGYVIAPYGMNLDGSNNDIDTLISKTENFVDRNLPENIIKKIEIMEQDRPYYKYSKPYAEIVRFGGTYGLYTTPVEELTLSERKVANIGTYGRVRDPEDIETYVERALQAYYLNDKNFIDDKLIND